MQPETKNIDINKIRLHEKTQPRCEIDSQLVEEYRLAIEDGAKMPPVVVFFDGCHYWLADGYHRYHAEKKVGSKEIKATIHQGATRDAILYACGANAEHGQRRTNADKRKAVLTLLEDKEWQGWSDRDIARRCAVDHVTVINHRASLVKVTSENTANGIAISKQPDRPTERTYKNKHGNISKMNVSRIGKAKQRPIERGTQEDWSIYKKVISDIQVSLGTLKTLKPSTQWRIHCRDKLESLARLLTAEIKRVTE